MIYTTPEPIALLEEIELLPSVLRLMIVLYYIDGYSVQEISDLTGIPTGTIKCGLMFGAWSTRSFGFFIPKQDCGQP